MRPRPPVERAADPLHRAWIDAKTFGDLASAFAGLLAFLQGGTPRLRLVAPTTKIEQSRRADPRTETFGHGST
jgi:hypothetical protein